MKDWLVYFSIAVFILTIAYLVIRFFVETKITFLIDSIFKRRSAAKANAEVIAVDELGTEDELISENVVRIQIERRGPFEFLSSLVTRFMNIFHSAFHDFWDAYEKKVPKNVRLLINITILVLLSRILIQAFGYMATLFIRGGALSTEAMWNKWDAPHYLQLAKDWYVGGSPDTDIFIVFYPLYPGLVRVFAFLTGGNAFWAAELVSTLCLIGSAFFLYKLVLMEFGKKVAFNSVKYLLIFPVSFFFNAPYTESLFVMLSILTFYCLRKQKWFLAGIFGLLAGLTRFHGIILFVPFVIEFLIQKDIFARLFSKDTKQAVKDIFKKGIFALLVPCGYLLYLGLNKIVTGNPFSYIYWQKEHWQQEFSIFFRGGVETVSRYVSVVDMTSDNSVKSFAANWLPQMIIITLAMLLILYAIKIKFSLSYFSYMSIYIFGTISLSYLLSSPRYIMAAFPIFILLALLSKNKKVDLIITIASIMMLMYCTAVFVSGGQLM
jgi:Gpi18-like mannosyltransferase